MVQPLLNTLLSSGHIRYQRHRNGSRFYNAASQICKNGCVPKSNALAVRIEFGMNKSWGLCSGNLRRALFPAGQTNQAGPSSQWKSLVSMHSETSARRIRVQKTLWVRYRCIPDSLQGRHAKTHCMLEDEGTPSNAWVSFVGACTQGVYIVCMYTGTNFSQVLYTRICVAET